VHQFVKIGAHAMIGFQGHVAQDVPPFVTVDGNPLAARAVNLTGLRRRGFSAERQAVIKQMYKLLYRSGLTLAQAQQAIEASRARSPRPTATSTACCPSWRPPSAASCAEVSHPIAPCRRRAWAWWPARPRVTCWPACCSAA
jgi:hypothetical protein